MGTEITSSPQIMYQEDVEYGAAISEAVGSKQGAVTNYVLNNFTNMQFGVVGQTFGGLATPYVFNDTTEKALVAYEIKKIAVQLAVSGTAGTTTFLIEKQLAAGGAWTNIFSTNCSILNTAADDIQFNSDDVAPTGVTLPVLSTTALAKGDKLRFTLSSVATGAKNIQVYVILKPV